MLLSTFYTDVFTPLVLRSRSTNTRRLYRTTLNNLGKFLERPPLLTDLNDLTVNKFLSWFRECGKSPFSVNKERSNILAMWRFACRKKYLDTWPDVPAEKTPQLIPLAWSEVELAALYAAAAKQIDSVGNVPASLWWTALLLVVWDTGERIGALLSTPRGGVDRKCEWLAVGHEYRKGQDKDRVYRLGPKTSEKVRELLARHSEKLLFPWPYTKTYIWNRLEKILKNAGLPTDKRCKFHRMRRSVASHYEAAGGDATALLGHANRRTTIKHYLDPRIVPAHKPACEVLFKLG